MTWILAPEVMTPRVTIINPIYFTDACVTGIGWLMGGGWGRGDIGLLGQISRELNRQKIPEKQKMKLEPTE